MGLEVFLKCERFILVLERAIPNQLPRLVFRGVSGLAGVVLWQPPFEVRRRARICVLREIDAADDVDVPHRASRLAGRNGSSKGYLALCFQPVVALRAMAGTPRFSGIAPLRHA